MDQAGGFFRTINMKRTNFTEAVRLSRDDDGLRAAARTAARWVAEGLSRPATDLRQRLFDRRLGVETRLADVPDATTIAAARFIDSAAYSPTPTRQFSRLLRALPIEWPAEYTFVDLGCGKGLTLMLAARHGFRPVRGVELDRRLVAVAEENIRSFVVSNPGYDGLLSVIGGDAADYSLPTGPTVVFLFNPFGPDTLGAVVANIERSLAASPDPFYLAYYNPVHRRVLDRCPYLHRLARTTRWALYEGRPLG